ncbi:hypothetical protein K435DRAFT_814970 [Dendrothele bispora CBS 962.96]|uniref:Uncharacterized protein n=1 Tax=Dendrothele bispora (strain CBS 962.96) TaxID=1314807 RepID=A0A4S8MYL9_DENBC|nr:hypothetical protein K435DRAFT_814970 [Dendrothele bispora CBS 962.96]
MSNSDDEFPELQPEHNPPTNYGVFVISTMKRMPAHGIDQTMLRKCIGLSPTYLLTDTCMDPEHGVSSWFIGFSRLIDVVVALHAKSELELETINAASRACSECWSVAGCWRGLEECRDGIRKVAIRLQKLLDENGRTYRGERVYAP